MPKCHPFALAVLCRTAQRLTYVFNALGQLSIHWCMQVCAAHAEWGRCYQAHVQQSAQQAPDHRFSNHDRDRDRPLVVGYVSADLFTHSVSYFAEAPLTCHSPDRQALPMLDAVSACLWLFCCQNETSSA